MKKFLILGTLTLISLNFFAQVGAEGEVTLITGIDWHRTLKGMEIKINLDSPARFICYDIASPPQIIVEFLGKGVYCQLPEAIKIEQEMVDRLRPVRAAGEPSGSSYPLDFLVVDLKASASYQVVEKGNSFSVVVSKAEAGKVQITVNEKSKEENSDPKTTKRRKKRSRFLKHWERKKH